MLIFEGVKSLWKKNGSITMMFMHMNPDHNCTEVTEIITGLKHTKVSL